jgi:hypothetical protein
MTEFNDVWDEFEMVDTALNDASYQDELDEFQNWENLITTLADLIYYYPSFLSIDKLSQMYANILTIFDFFQDEVVNYPNIFNLTEDLLLLIEKKIDTSDILSVNRIKMISNKLLDNRYFRTCHGCVKVASKLVQVDVSQQQVSKKQKDSGICTII